MYDSTASDSVAGKFPHDHSRRLFLDQTCKRWTHGGGAATHRGGVLDHVAVVIDERD